MTLAIAALGFAYPGRAPILHEVTLTVAPGECVAILGANGSGKSTLARLLAGLQAGSGSGRVTWAGAPWHARSAAERVALVQHVGQRPHLQISGRGATVREEIAFGPENLCLPPAETRARVEAALALMRLEPLADRDCRTLSGGEAQRVAVAGALAMRPALLVLDEPSTDLDADSRAALAALLRAPPWPMAAVVVDVDLDPELSGVVRRRMLLRHGRLAETAAGGRHDGAAFPPPGGPGGAARPPASAPTGAAPAAVELRGVSFAWPGREPVLSGLDLALPGGAVAAVLGPNGAGKSTLLRLIAGLEAPAGGSISVAGHVLPRDDPRAVAALVGIVFQSSDRHFLRARVLDEVALGPRLQGDRDPRGSAWAALDRLGLADVAEAHTLDLDAGRRRLVAVAAAIAHRPRVLLLDEALRVLDRGNRRRLETVVAEEAARGAAVVIVTHDPDVVARTTTCRIDLGLRLTAADTLGHRAPAAGRPQRSSSDHALGRSSARRAPARPHTAVSARSAVRVETCSPDGLS